MRLIAADIAVVTELTFWAGISKSILSLSSGVAILETLERDLFGGEGVPVTDGSSSLERAVLWPLTLVSSVVME